MRTRLGLVLSATAVALLSLSAIARACDSVGASISPDSARAGEPITFSISGLLPGATYTVTRDGETVASGVSDGDSVHGSFPMPDYGSQPRSVDVEVVADHTEDGFAKTVAYKPVAYLPPPSAAPAKPPPSSAVSGPASSPQAVKQVQKSRPAPVATPGAPGQRDHAAASVAVVGAAPAESVGSEPRSSNPASGSGAAENTAQRQESASVPDRVLDAIGSSTKVGPAEVPTLGLLAAGLIIIAGTAMAAFVIYLLRRGPDPEAAIKVPAPIDPDPVEAELQEMIADEMARQLLSELDLGKPSVDSRLVR